MRRYLKSYEANQEEVPALPHGSSTDAMVGDVEAAAMTCPQGHALLGSQPSWLGSRVHCQLCSQSIPKREAGSSMPLASTIAIRCLVQVRMTCKPCKYSAPGL